MVDGLLMSILLFLTHLISMHSFAPCELTASRAYTVCVFGVLSMKQISMLSNKSTNSVYQSNESCDCSFQSKSVLFSFYVLHSVLFHSKIALLSIVYSGLSSGSRVQTNREFRWSISSTTWSSYTQNTTKDFKQNTNIRKAEKQSEKKQRTEPWTNTNGGSQWGNKVGISCELNSKSDFSTTRSFVGFVFFFLD